MRCSTIRFGCSAVVVRCSAVLYVTVYAQRDRMASRLILRYGPERQIAQISVKFRFSVYKPLKTEGYPAAFNPLRFFIRFMTCASTINAPSIPGPSGSIGRGDMRLPSVL